MWTGTEMIVWAGRITAPILTPGAGTVRLPILGQLRARGNAPAGTIGGTRPYGLGSEMIHLGLLRMFPGNTVFATGGKYNPNTDS